MRKYQKGWSRRELQAALQAYFYMLNMEMKGEPYRKSDVREGFLSKQLRGRSRGAFEYRMQNISAILDELGEPVVSGYKPAKNVGTHIREHLFSLMKEMGYLR